MYVHTFQIESIVWGMNMNVGCDSDSGAILRIQNAFGQQVPTNTFKYPSHRCGKMHFDPSIELPFLD